MATKGMSKILQGVLKYNQTVKGELVPYFREILDKPSPKSVLVSGVDSRIVATRLLQAEPGAYFFIRSPGGLVPKFEESNAAAVPSGTAATFELACVVNKCNTCGVVGHSDCKTLNVLFDMRKNMDDPAHKNSELKKWLLHNGRESLLKFNEFEKSGFKKPLTFHFNGSFEAHIDPENRFDAKDKFSQINTLEQLNNISNYAFLKDRIKKNLIKGYALWVDVVKSDVYLFSFNEKRFVKIDESTYEKLYAECSTEFD